MTAAIRVSVLGSDLRVSPKPLLQTGMRYLRRDTAVLRLEVIDVQNGKRLHTIADLAEPQGLYYDPSTNRLFLACAKDGTTKVYIYIYNESLERLERMIAGGFGEGTKMQLSNLRELLTKLQEPGT